MTTSHYEIILNTGITLQWDPLKKFSYVSPDELKYYIGILPAFAEDFDPSQESLEEKMLHAYGFPVPPMTGFSISPEGILSYPDDPDLYPICVMSTQGQKVYIYHYGIVYFPLSETIYRMD